jgi:hypothetical protein
MCDATRDTGGVFYFSLRSSNINPKEKGKKESAFRGAEFCRCKIFDLKIFRTRSPTRIRIAKGKILSETRRA